MNKNVTVYLRGKDVDCIGIYDISSKCVKILKGSIIRKKTSKQFKYNKKRSSQIKEFCEEKGDSFILIKDALFTSPSAAAKFSLGYEVNGPSYWKDKDNVKLRDIIYNIKK